MPQHHDALPGATFDSTAVSKERLAWCLCPVELPGFHASGANRDRRHDQRSAAVTFLSRVSLSDSQPFRDILSKQLKDLSDIARMLEVSPDLRTRVPPEILARIPSQDAGGDAVVKPPV